jgi:Sec-independent protein translocase protein TatA
VHHAVASDSGRAEHLIILAIVVVLFGASRIGDIGKGSVEAFASFVTS